MKTSYSITLLFELMGSAHKGHDQVKSGGLRDSTKGSDVAASFNTTRPSGSGGYTGSYGAVLLEGEVNNRMNDLVVRKRTAICEQLRKMQGGFM
jgi:hypothetical protein